MPVFELKKREYGNNGKYQAPLVFFKFDLITWKGGSLKCSLGMTSSAFTIPKAFGFEAATQPSDYNLQIQY